MDLGTSCVEGESQCKKLFKPAFFVNYTSLKGKLVGKYGFDKCKCTSRLAQLH